MRRYETIFILEPDVSEEQRKPLYDKLDELFEKYKGLLIKRDEWGVKHLAYSIRKLNRGFYTRMEYCGDGALVDEMERFFRINDRFMRYLTVLLDRDADIEQVKAEIAQAEAEAAARKKSAEEAAAKAAAAAAEKAAEKAEAAPAETPAPPDEKAAAPAEKAPEAAESPSAPKTEASTGENPEENETGSSE